MAVDILGQEITVGARVLWGSHGGYSGFHGGRPLRVKKITAKQVTLEVAGSNRSPSVPFSSVVVVDKLLAN